MENITHGLLASLPSNVEIVISDNSDVENTLLSTLSNKCSRLVYAHHTTPLSFSDNFTKCLELSNGDYLLAIGDDDYVFPWIVEFVEKASLIGIDTIVYPFTATYYWPGVTGRTSKSDGLARISFSKHNYDDTFDQKHVLRQLIDSGFTNYNILPLARIYHGVVSRDLVDLIVKLTGNIYGGLSPDIYSSVKLSYHSSSPQFLHIPLSLPGTCAESGGGQSAAGTHRGKLSEAPHFKGNASYAWEIEVPRFYSVETIWAESAIKSIRECTELTRSSIRINKLVGVSIVNNKSLAKIIIQKSMDTKKGPRKKLILILEAMYFAFNHLSIKILNSLKSRFRKNIVFRGVDISTVAKNIPPETFY